MAAVLRRVVAGETGQAIQGEAQQGINRLLEGALIGYIFLEGARVNI